MNMEVIFSWISGHKNPKNTEFGWVLVSFGPPKAERFLNPRLTVPRGPDLARGAPHPQAGGCQCAFWGLINKPGPEMSMGVFFHLVVNVNFLGWFRQWWPHVKDLLGNPDI